MNLTLLRAGGIAGMLGAVLWSLGDVLLVGAIAAPQDYPLLLKDYADRIPFKALNWMLPSSEPRLAVGALLPDVAVPLYLAGSWHLFQGVRPVGKWLAFATFALLACGNAWSPLGHAAFYYPGMVYKTIMDTPIEAHGALLSLGSQFNRMLMVAWLLPVLTLACGMSLLALAIATGRTSYPRWTALLLNPVSPLLVAAVGGFVSPSPVAGWFHAAVLNIGFFLIYSVSTVLLWNGVLPATGLSALQRVGDGH